MRLRLFPPFVAVFACPAVCVGLCHWLGWVGSFEVTPDLLHFAACLGLLIGVYAALCLLVNQVLG